jgi:hypothetical protein
MGYLLALCIGFAIGWLSATLLISGSRMKTGVVGTQTPAEGVDPVCESCQLMG